MMPMPQTLLAQVKNVVEVMSPIKALCCDVENFNWDYYESTRTKDNVVIFIDPPYKGTTGYGFNLDYEEWYNNLNLPDNYSLWITDYKTHGFENYSLLKTSKGGISGKTSKTREEILSKIF